MQHEWAADPPVLVAGVYGWLMRWLNARPNAALLAVAEVVSGERALEIGCGPGQLIEGLVAAVGPDGHVIGVDPSAPLRRMAARANAAAIAAGRAEIVDGRASALPADGASVDVVLSAHTFQFWSAPEAAFTEIRRVLVPAGRLALQLRLHGPATRPHLPNPLSHGDDEIGAARAALERADFVCELQRGSLLCFRKDVT